MDKIHLGSSVESHSHCGPHSCIHTWGHSAHAKLTWETTHKWNEWLSEMELEITTWYNCNYILLGYVHIAATILQMYLLFVSNCVKRYNIIWRFRWAPSTSYSLVQISICKPAAAAAGHQTRNKGYIAVPFSLTVMSLLVTVKPSVSVASLYCRKSSWATGCTLNTQRVV